MIKSLFPFIEIFPLIIIVNIYKSRLALKFTRNVIVFNHSFRLIRCFVCHNTIKSSIFGLATIPILVKIFPLPNPYFGRVSSSLFFDAVLRHSHTFRYVYHTSIIICEFARIRSVRNYKTFKDRTVAPTHFAFTMKAIIDKVTFKRRTILGIHCSEAH